MSAISVMARAAIRELRVILPVTLLAGCAAPQPPAQWDGLEYRAVAGFDAAYVRPGTGFADYRSLMIDPVSVSFDKRWDPAAKSATEPGGMTPGQIQALRDGMAAELGRLLEAELIAGGYTIVTTPAPDTLRLSPSIVDLIVTPPGSMAPGKGQVYSLDAGRMTLLLELRDAPSGQLLARVVDQKAGTRTGDVQVDGRELDAGLFRRAASDWARSFRAALDAIYARPR